MSKKAKKVFMCGTDSTEELDHSEVPVFPTAKLCKKVKGCTTDCGIVEVQVRLVRWIKKPKY